MNRLSACTSVAVLVAVVALVAAPALAVNVVVVPYGAQEIAASRPAVGGFLYKIVPHGVLPGFEAVGFDAFGNGFLPGASPFASLDNTAGCALFNYAQTDWDPIDTDLLVRLPVRLCADGSMTNVRIGVAIDNDARLWLNGQPGVPLACNPVSPDGLCQTEYCATFDKLVFQIPAANLLNGTNLLAVRARDRTVVSFLDVQVSADFVNEADALVFQATGELPCDNEPPVCAGATASIDQIWPPNHKWNAVGVTGVTDPDGDAVAITITGIFQDEGTRALGSGDTCPDGDGVGTGMAYVRAERSGTPKVPGNGRVYHINFTASDGKGGTCSGSVRTCVPHDQGQGQSCVDGGALFNSTVCQ